MPIYPQTLKENMKFRYDLVEVCKKDITIAQKTKALVYKDILFFFNVFLFAEDPFAAIGERHGIDRVRNRPIITYPFQDKFILDLSDAIDKGEDIITDKSRDMLATYMVLGVFYYKWLTMGKKFMITSWKEDEIDGKEDTSTHFGKLRMFMKYMPHFLYPKGFDIRRHSSSMRLNNPENGGTIVGSAASAGLGSGRREDAIFFDELSKWQTNSKEAWTSASDTTRCKIGVWTPRGAANFAAMLMRGTEVKRKHKLHWYLHPEKTFTTPEHLENNVKAGLVKDKVRNYTVQVHSDQSKALEGCYIDQFGRIRSEWYDKECEKRQKEDIAENLDCDYLSTGNPVFDTTKCQQKLYEAKPPAMVGELNWRVRPIFDDNKNCINKKDLVVEFVKNSNGNVKVWEEPIGDWENGYCIAADTAEGLEQGDYDGARVLRRIPKDGQGLDSFVPEMVATIHGHLKTFEYAEELAKLAVWYGYAWVAVERNNHGHAVINELLYYYDKLYHNDVMTKGYPERSDKIGFETTKHSKPIVIKNLSKAISQDLFIDNDDAFWAETLTFVNNDGKLEAQGKSDGNKCFDDLVMATSICLWINDNTPTPTRKREKTQYRGWRESWNDTSNKSELVRWVI